MYTGVKEEKKWNKSSANPVLEFFRPKTLAVLGKSTDLGTLSSKRWPWSTYIISLTLGSDQ